MEALNRMAESLMYMEDRLGTDLNVEDVAKIACMSKFHYQRMFTMLTGFTVAEYIRKRRLTLAAQELLHSNTKVIDVALKYGYETPESFSKAFRKVHGLSPSSVRKHDRQLKAFPKLSFQIQLKGDEEMDYRIVEKEAFSVIGKSIKTSLVDGQNKIDVPAFWEESLNNGLDDKLAVYAGEMGVMGICMEFDKEQEQVRYFIGAEKPNKGVPETWEEGLIPAATWAVFPVNGPMPGAIQRVWERIFSEWFPSTGYEHAGGPEIEAYTNGDPYHENYYSEIWIPIVKN
ncbi:AraC family transcriptional regulator [Oceanobacillus manasiensis]|uniref:AraC family transcriptional regulator n=1 Tax=Oceanobacillus manasiensis TaxID=586413 RepID=UPI0005A9A471|nr:AraC family transcriptional regulator [Oceanobacillus manasiensis]